MYLVSLVEDRNSNASGVKKHFKLGLCPGISLACMVLQNWIVSMLRSIIMYSNGSILQVIPIICGLCSRHYSKLAAERTTLHWDVTLCLLGYQALVIRININAFSDFSSEHYFFSVGFMHISVTFTC